MTTDRGEKKCGVFIYRGGFSQRVFLARQWYERPSGEPGKALMEIVGRKEDITEAMERFLADEEGR